MDPVICRDALARMIGEEQQLLAELEALLEQEHRHLLDADVDALEQAGDTRQRCMTGLLRIDEERRALCRMSGRDADLNGLESLLKWCDAGGSLQSSWRQCATRAQRCRDLNERNGVLVTARLKRVQGMLGVITGQSHAAATYDRGGLQSNSATGRMISGAA